MSRRRKLERGRRSVLASVVALILIAVTILLAVAAFQVHAGRDSTALGHVSVIADRLRTNNWNDVEVIIAGVVLAVLGLLLLLAGLLPARRPMITLADLDAHTICGITRRGLIRDLAATAAGVDGVVAAKVRMRRRRISVRATTGMSDRGTLADNIRTAIQRRVDGLEPARGFVVRARVRGGES